MTQALRRVFYGLLIAIFFLGLGILAQQGAKSGEWRAYGGDEGSTRYSPLDQINRDNIKDLRVAWVWKSDSLIPNPQADQRNHAHHGQWRSLFHHGWKAIRRRRRRGNGRNDLGLSPQRGREVRRGAAQDSSRRVLLDRRQRRRAHRFRDARIQPHRAECQDRTAGSRFGTNGIVDMMKDLDIDYKGDPNGRIGNSSPVVISNDVIVVGPAHLRPTRVNVKGDVLAYDVRTGKKKWIFHTIPRKGEYGYDTWLNGSAEYTGSVGVWGPFSADPELGYVYLNTEAPTNDL